MPFLFWRQGTEEGSHPGSSVVRKCKGRALLRVRGKSEGQGAVRGERE